MASRPHNAGYRFELITRRPHRRPQRFHQSRHLRSMRGLPGSMIQAHKQLDVSEIAVRTNADSELYRTGGCDIWSRIAGDEFGLRIPGMPVAMSSNYGRYGLPQVPAVGS